MPNKEFHHDPHTLGRAYSNSFLPEHTLGRGHNKPLSPVNELKRDESSLSGPHIEGLGALPILTLEQAILEFGTVNDNQNLPQLSDRSPKRTPEAFIKGERVVRFRRFFEGIFTLHLLNHLLTVRQNYEKEPEPVVSLNFDFSNDLANDASTGLEQAV